MIIKDIIYGEFKINPIISEIINTDVIQRLKKIHQGGANFLVNPNWNVTRYDHSIGTMLLINLLGGSLEEQIAGLLHDISHTAFSHVIDYVLDNKDEDYHEKILNDVVNSSSIPEILNKNGFNPNDIIYNYSKWGILEKSAPKLCADRIDYTLRDMFNDDVITKDEIKNFLSSLTIIDNEIVITDIKVAEWFVETYYKEVIDLFMNPLSIYSNSIISKAIKIALDSNEISLADFMKDDDYLLNKLESSDSNEIKNLLSMLNTNIKLIEDEKDYDIHQKNKVRTIDPTLFLDNKKYIASEKSTLIKELTKKALTRAQKGSYIKIK